MKFTYYLKEQGTREDPTTNYPYLLGQALGFISDILELRTKKQTKQEFENRLNDWVEKATKFYNENTSLKRKF